MTDTPTKPPSGLRPVKLDEWIAIFVSLGTFGSIFFWATTRENNGFNLLSKTMVSTPLSETVGNPNVGNPNIVSEKSIFSLSTPQLKTPTDKSASNSDQASLSSEESGTSMATLTPMTDTVENLEPNIQGLDQLKTKTKTRPELVRPPKITSKKATSQVGDNLAILDGIKILSKYPATISTAKFSDIPNSFWASSFIQSLVERGIITQVDNDNFEPDKPVTRAEFAAQIPKVFEEKSTKISVNYKDVKGDSRAETEIQTATKSGFLSGYPGNVFRPEQEVSRLQVLIALASGLSLEIPSDPDSILSVYKDKEEIPGWAREKIAATTAAGLVVSHPDVKILNPNKPATRAEVAAIFYQALVKLGQVKQIPSEYIVSPKKEN